MQGVFVLARFVGCNKGFLCRLQPGRAVRSQHERARGRGSSGGRHRRSFRSRARGRSIDRSIRPSRSAGRPGWPRVSPRCAVAAPHGRRPRLGGRAPPRSVSCPRLAPCFYVRVARPVVASRAHARTCRSHQPQARAHTRTLAS